MFINKFYSKTSKFLHFVIILIATGCFSNYSYQTLVPEPISPQSRRGSLPKNVEPGKCYAQYTLQKIIVDTLNFIEYT